MLRRTGLEFQVKAAAVDEGRFPAESPEEYVLRVSGEKAKGISASVPETWVVAADTIVVLGSDILGKPEDGAAALAMLKRLSGKRHRVLTAFCVRNVKQNRMISQLAETEVRFNDLSDEMLEAYVKTGDPLDKAGGYGIQSFGGVLVKEIIGSYTNVVGLPLAELTNELLTLGIIASVL